MVEVWKDVPSYEGLYKVSNLGRVKRLFKNGKENILKCKTTQDGYVGVILSKNQTKKHVRVHRLVAEVFVPNYENKPQVNHRDRNKKNNIVDINDVHGEATNLEWVTAAENAKHCFSTGRKIHRRAVFQFTKNMERVSCWDSIREASKRLEISEHNINSCCNGHLKTAGGFVWRYKGVDV